MRPWALLMAAAAAGAAVATLLVVVLAGRRVDVRTHGHPLYAMSADARPG